MGRRSDFTKEQKIETCENYLKGNASVAKLANLLNCNIKTVRTWVYEYKIHREKSFEKKIFNSSYSKEFKLKVINEYNSGMGSLQSLTNKYNIKSKSILLNWIKKYNNGIEIEDYNPQSEVYSMKSRNTTYEERVEIVNYALTNQDSYKGAASKFSVSYHFIFNLVKKYEKGGYSALEFKKRGRKLKNNLNNDSLTEIEELKRELQLEKNKVEYLQFENEVLKKKEYFSKKIYSRKSDKKRST